jgi:DNA invertase Pin-like site-specific DNA recombinase
VPTKKKLSIVDPQTGQVVEADAVVYYGKAKKDKNFINILHTFIKDAVRDRELRPALDLLVYIMSEKLEKDSLKFYMTAEEVIKNLGVSRDTYYRWLKTLLKKGYLVRINTNYYTLNL